MKSLDEELQEYCYLTIYEDRPLEIVRIPREELDEIIQSAIEAVLDEAIKVIGDYENVDNANNHEEVDNMLARNELRHTIKAKLNNLKEQ